MRSIPNAVKSTIETDGFLHFGLANRVLNLSKTARFIKPLIESRTKKQVSFSAITMALSRLRLHKHRENTRLKSVKLNAINVTKNLVDITFDKTRDNVHSLEKATARIRNANAYIVATYGTTELTVILDQEYERALKRSVGASPIAEIRNLVAIGVQFDEKYIEQVGMVYTLIQQLTFQNVNVVEFSSTNTELVFYVHKRDMKVAFDTLYDQFM